MATLSLNICLSDIPADKRIKGKDGKIYANFWATSLKEPDNFKNDHTVYMTQTKEEREAKAEKAYVGRGKEYTFNDNKPQPQAQSAPQESGNGDGLPF